MTHLSVCLLGSFQATLEDQGVIDFETTKARALLAYLAVEADRPHRREALAEMLWPDRPEGAARANLRHTLAGLRRAIGDQDAVPPFLLITRKTIQFNSDSDAWVDVAAFETMAAQGVQSGRPNVGQLEEAAELYRGAFLECVSVRDSAAFEEWALLRREQFRRQVLGVLNRLAVWYAQLGDHRRALEHARRWVELEPLEDEAQHRFIQLLALSGRRSEAIRQYETFERALAKDDLEPLEETKKLVEGIREGRELGKLKTSGWPTP